MINLSYFEAFILIVIFAIQATLLIVLLSRILKDTNRHVDECWYKSQLIDMNDDVQQLSKNIEIELENIHRKIDKIEHREPKRTQTQIKGFLS